MRIAVVSDIHGNLTALEAVVADLQSTAPDLVLHGGDLADSGPQGAEVVDRIRELGWPGVVGNTDEMLFAPESLANFAARLPALQPMFQAIAEMAGRTREQLGENRLEWLRTLPRTHQTGKMLLVHATPADLWRAPAPSAEDGKLEDAYNGCGDLVVYGHVHVPFVRQPGGRVIANSGSAGMPYDGDPRAAYLLVDDGVPAVRRVAYDVERAVRALRASGMPHADWVARMLTAATPLPIR